MFHLLDMQLSHMYIGRGGEGRLPPAPPPPPKFCLYFEPSVSFRSGAAASHVHHVRTVQHNNIIVPTILENCCFEVPIILKELPALFVCP